VKYMVAYDPDISNNKHSFQRCELRLWITLVGYDQKDSGSANTSVMLGGGCMLFGRTPMAGTCLIL
jgi:hypothetical protein